MEYKRTVGLVETDSRHRDAKEELLKAIELKQKALLAETDWACTVGNPHCTQAMLDYRAAVRAVNNVYADNPEDVVFPVAP